MSNSKKNTSQNVQSSQNDQPTKNKTFKTQSESTKITDSWIVVKLHYQDSTIPTFGTLSKLGDGSYMIQWERASLEVVNPVEALRLINQSENWFCGK